MRLTDFVPDPLEESLCWSGCTKLPSVIEESVPAVEGAWVAGVCEQALDAGVPAGGSVWATSALSASGLGWSCNEAQVEEGGDVDRWGWRDAGCEWRR